MSKVLKHGLNISNDLSVIVDYGDSMATLVVISKQDVFSTEIDWWAGGELYFINKGISPVSTTISFVPKDINQNVWFFADSYFDWRYNARWPFYLLQQGYEKWMADHRPGEASEEALECFEYDVQLGNPLCAVWCMGMNDASDTDAPDGGWLNAIEQFISICERKHIIPILSTIPNVSVRNHRKKERMGQM